MRLICAAWNEELKAVSADALQAALGIGYLEAALELNRILNQHSEINEIIFLGTCGSYNQELNIGDLVEVSSVSLLERGAVLGLAYSVREADCFTSFAMTSLQGDCHAASQLAMTPCLCSLEITNSSELSARILEHYCFTKAVENMELYGVARVATERGIKWSARLGVTNYADLNAHRDWVKNQQQVSKQLGRDLLQV